MFSLVFLCIWFNCFTFSLALVMSNPAVQAENSPLKPLPRDPNNRP